MLCSGFNVVGFNWISSPAETELESIVVDWIGKSLKLPSSFLFAGTGGGVLHGSTCEVAVCVLAAARDKALNELGGWEHMTKLAVYASDQTHFTLQKAAKLVGIPPSNFRLIETSFSTVFSMSPEKVGTVDPIAELGKVAMNYKLWLHVDSAYAGSACICHEILHYLDGVVLANSISMNRHKWFLTNMDCCCLWIKEPKLLTDSLSSDPEILSNREVDPKKHGLDNLMYHVRSDIAKHFEAFVRKDERFEIVVLRKFALVCFRLNPKIEEEDEDRELNCKLVEAINSSGRAFLSQAVVGGIYVIRCAIGATLTQQHHVVNLWKLIQQKAQNLLM
ncbi:hypothetical protein F3Y22_tig00111558pilonHSYRG00041 [Hibiscus syriacus]|uniref:Uncharacterized protein n=1 Tax=Hibiscus syriacus TaxID=106335 RepID=A0A6A2Y6M1_HIBSY|nr:hypothetical protein F3Y22_tig00111558pilonHSYRG00041 [Hibiscus syriacus]